MHRRQPCNALKFRLRLPQGILCALSLGGVDHGPDEHFGSRSPVPHHRHVTMAPNYRPVLASELFQSLVMTPLSFSELSESHPGYIKVFLGRDVQGRELLQFVVGIA